MYSGSRAGDMDVAAAEALGELPGATTVDLAAGVQKNDWSLDLFVTNLTGEDAPFYRTTECVVETCGAQPYGVRIRPTTLTLRFTKNYN